MLILALSATASFTKPENIGTTAASMLWLLPLIASIAVTYKATKVPDIKAADFIKEVVLLFGSIVVFMAVIAVGLYGVERLITE